MVGGDCGGASDNDNDTTIVIPRDCNGDCDRYSDCGDGDAGNGSNEQLW